MKVLVFPYDVNPYQKLLYTAMRKAYGKQITISYAYFLPFIGALHLPLELLIRRLLGYKIIHIHWIAFYLKLAVPGQKKLSLYLTRWMLWWLKALGYKIIWTVHDMLPHDQETADDLDVSKRFAQGADAKIAHSTSTISQMEEIGLDTTRTILIPHGNYGTIYDNKETPRSARQKLGISPDKLVILFFGIIKAYKGVDMLLDAFTALKNPKLQLVIAGKCMDDELRVRIQQLNHPSILFTDDYIAGGEVATYFKAADVVCAPFRSITTSGSVLLAITFGKPLVAPRLGSLRDIPIDAGCLYDPEDPTALLASLEQIAGNPDQLRAMSARSAAYARTLDWDGLAKQTYGLYTNVLTRKDQA